MTLKRFNVICSLFFVLLLLVLAAGSEVRAAVPSPGASCADNTAGATACYSNGCYLCSGGVWVAQAFVIGNTATACSSTIAGQVRYSSSSLQYCDGTSWTTLSVGELGTSATATSPSRAGDVRTGLFSATASTVSIATAGTERLRVTATGSVGIGTTAPAADLHVNGDVTLPTADTSLSFGSDVRQMLNLYSTTYGIGVQGSTFYNRSGNHFAWYKGGVHSDTALDPGAGGSALMVLTTTGSVGIGTTAPSAKLEIASGEVQVGTSGTACSSAKAGAIRWTGSAFQGCNGSSWVSLGGGGTVDFGAPTAITTGTVYNASSAGIVVVRATGDVAGVSCVLVGYTDSSSTPTTMYVRASGGNGEQVSITFPVRATHYYKFTNSSCGNLNGNFFPLTFS